MDLWLHLLRKNKEPELSEAREAYLAGVLSDTFHREKIYACHSDSRGKDSVQLIPHVARLEEIAHNEKGTRFELRKRWIKSAEQLLMLVGMFQTYFRTQGISQKPFVYYGKEFYAKAANQVLTNEYREDLMGCAEDFLPMAERIHNVMNQRQKKEYQSLVIFQ